MKSIRPDSQYMRNLTAIFNQKKDQIILDSLTGTVLVQQRTGQGQTSNKTMAYGTGLTAAQVTARGLLTGVTQTGDYTWTGETAKTLAHYNGYEGHEIGCKLSRKYENLFAQGESAGTLPDTAAILSGGSPNDQTPLVSTKPGADTVGLVSIAGGATLDSLALDSTTTTLSTTGVTPFNIEKLIRARQKLDSTHALRAGGRYICVLHPDQFYSLMADASDVRFNSIDFNDGKPLINGEAFRFMGFEFRMSTLIPQATVTMPESSTSVAGANWSRPLPTLSLIHLCRLRRPCPCHSRLYPDHYNTTTKP